MTDPSMMVHDLLNIFSMLSLCMKLWWYFFMSSGIMPLHTVVTSSLNCLLLNQWIVKLVITCQKFFFISFSVWVNTWIESNTYWPTIRNNSLIFIYLNFVYHKLLILTLVLKAYTLKTFYNFMVYNKVKNTLLFKLNKRYKMFQLTNVAAFAWVRAVLFVGPFWRLYALVTPVVRVIVARAVVPALLKRTTFLQILHRVCCKWYKAKSQETLWICILWMNNIPLPPE